MSLPGLRPALTLETEPTARLVDSLTHEVLALTQTEAKLLQAWNGAASAVQLSAKVFINGLDVEPWQVEQFFTRLERMRLLSAPPPIVPDFIPPKPGVELLEDRVPALRGDLVIARLMPSGEVLEVFEPQRSRGFSLLDFEITLARLLDGKRTAAEVIEHANALGIPATLATLQAFLQQLRAYAFIDPRVRGGTTTWPARTAWSDEVRETYRRALVSLRSGQLEDASTELDALGLEGEALRLRLGSKLIKVELAVLHGPPTPTEVIRTGQFDALTPGDARAPQLKIDPFASFGFDGELPTKSGLPALPETLSSAASKRTWKKRLAIAGVVLFVLVLLRPVPTVRSVPCVLEVVKLGVPRASLVGAVTPGAVKPGETVKQGAVLATIESTDAEAAVDKQLAALEKQVLSLAPVQNPTKLAKARAAVKSAQTAVTATEKQKKTANKKKLPPLEKKLAAQQKALAGAKAALEALTHDAARAPVAAELKALKDKKTKGLIEKPRADLVAPVEGVFLALPALPTRVFETDGYGQIVGPEFKFTFKKPLDTKAERAVFRAGEVSAEVGLENGTAHLAVTPALVGLKGDLEFSEGRKPWLFSF